VLRRCGHLKGKQTGKRDRFFFSRRDPFEFQDKFRSSKCHTVSGERKLEGTYRCGFKFSRNKTTFGIYHPLRAPRSYHPQRAS